MNRSNISKQLNYGDLSRFVGQPVGQQFAKKRYAEGDTVAEELTGRVTYEDVKGKKRTYMYDPLKMERPDSTGRGKVIGVDYKTAAYKPGINFFDYAQLVEEPAEQIARQEQEVPVSVTEEPFWTDADIDYHQTPPTYEGQGTGVAAMEAAEKRAADAARFGMMLPFGGLGGIAPRFLSNMSWGNTKENIDKGIGPELLGLTEKGEIDRTRGASVAVLEDALKGKESYYKGKGEDKDEGIGGGTNKQDSYSRARGAQLLGALYAQGKSLGTDLSKLGGGTLTQNDINNIMGGTGDYKSGTAGPGGGGWGLAASAMNPETGEFIEDERAAAEEKASQAFYDANAQARQTAEDAYFGTDGTAGTGSSEDFGGMFSGITDFSFGASGGVAQLASGGIAPSDKHLDPGSFVLSADVVSGVGDGSTEAGIERMSGLLGIPLDGSVSGPDGSMLGRVTTADGGPVPGTGLSDSVSTVIQDTDTVRLNVGNNPLKQMTPQGKTAARVARDELVVDTKTIANLPQMFMGAKGPDLKQGQQMLTNFMDNVRANKTNTGGKQPGPLVPEGQDVMKGLASLFQRA